MNTLPPAPVWLAEEPWLQELLLWFIGKLEKQRSRDVTRLVKQKTVPALFDFSEDTKYRWELIERELVQRYQVFSISSARRSKQSQEPYENVQLRLNAATEPLLRHWLNRPRISPEEQNWQAAIDLYAHHFIDHGAALRAQRLTLPGYSSVQLVAGIASAGTLLGQSLTLREISAHCFLGNSKVLDNRQELLTRLFGDSISSLIERPLLLTAWAPAGFSKLLFIENQDTFLHLTEQPPSNSALVYSGGFRASASRLISSATRFAFLPGSDADGFKASWKQPSIQAFFWGDLDYAGMGILRALRLSLPHLLSWQPGYRQMLNALHEGAGHTPEQGGKGGQIDPIETGCDYADQQLLPALRMAGRFLDQEGFHSRTTGSIADTPSALN
ncbi:Wadjet anti-phage system protein JetD domain-containing protein [Pseudomonas sp. FME51]|uniref:Wadjet anti-phage system protein JetD domain-containing protein n=1 Tax=Pseudomonas sp. FME51 TaxID=2742609 RepID=UPI0018664339|nr:Wadjet anti-phage system protein JetD domain-containing protein [Pseudomonas sp. FME51]